MEERKIRVRFLKSTSLIDPEAVEGKTCRTFMPGDTCEVTLEVFQRLMKEQACVPAGEQHGGVIAN